MKHLTFLCFLFGIILNVNGQTIFVTKKASVKFFSETPMENIEAITETVNAGLNDATGKVVVKIPIKTFKFERSLMEEHFNENYLESDKFPYATFTGTLDNAFLTNKSSFNGNITGDLTIHGVTQKKAFPIKIINNNGIYSTTLQFKVKLADFDIKIPTLVIEKIAEEVLVTCNIDLKQK